jgi:hypothetical protein
MKRRTLQDNFLVRRFVYLCNYLRRTLFDEGFISSLRQWKKG